MQEQAQELHPCLIAYGECSFGPNCLYTESPRDACIYYLKGKCTNPKASQCNNGKHYPELAKTMKEAQAALFAAGPGATPRIPKKVWRPHGSHGWKVGGLFCTRCGTALTTPEAKVMCKNAPADYKEEEEPAESTDPAAESTEERAAANGTRGPCKYFREGLCLADPCAYSHAAGGEPLRSRKRERRGDRSDRRDSRGPRTSKDSFQTFHFSERDNGFVTHDLAEGPPGEWLQSGKRIRRPSRSEEYERDYRPPREEYERDYRSSRDYERDYRPPRGEYEDYRPRGEYEREFRPRPREVIGGLGVQAAAQAGAQAGGVQASAQAPAVDVLPAIHAKGKFY